MQQPQGRSAEDGTLTDQRALENEIVVIKEIDQTSRQRFEDRARDSPGVDSTAGT